MAFPIDYSLLHAGGSLWVGFSDVSPANVLRLSPVNHSAIVTHLPSPPSMGRGVKRMSFPY